MKARSLLLAALCLGGCAAPQVDVSVPAGPPSRLRPDIERFVSWLPPDTETLFVHQVPGRVPIKKEGHRLGDCMHQLSALRLPMAAEGEKDISIAYDVVVGGARNVRPVAGMGMAAFDGCVIFAGATGQPDLTEWVKRKSSRSFAIGPTTVYVWDHKTLRSYMAILDEAFLVASDEKYLRQVLTRRANVVTDRALPSSLVLWRHIPVDSRFFAVREVDFAKMWENFEGPAPDDAPKTIRYAVWVDKAGKELNIIQAFDPPTPVAKVKEIWSRSPIGREEPPLLPKVKELDAGATLVTFGASAREHENAAFLLLNALGFPVFM